MLSAKKSRGIWMRCFTKIVLVVFLATLILLSLNIAFAATENATNATMNMTNPFANVRGSAAPFIPGGAA